MVPPAALKEGKAPGPDGLKKEDLTLDTEQTAGCLSLIFNKSLKFGKPQSALDDWWVGGKSGPGLTVWKTAC